MRKNLNILLLFSIFILVSCQKENRQPETTQAQLSNDTFFHYSIWWAFVNKVFDADLSVAEVKKRGDVGLGSFNLLDGEMVMVDGIPYRIRQNGEVSVGADTDTLVYANAAFFNKDFSFKIGQTGINLDTMKSLMTKQFPSPNFFYVIIIKGTYNKIKLGGLHKQTKPFTEGLDVLIPNRPVFEATNISGTMVGFYCPEFIGNINVKGFHFHFISDDKKYGGHVMEFESAGELSVELDKKADYHFYLPDNEDFANVGFDKEFQYKKN